MDPLYIQIPEELFATAESSLYSGTIECPEFTQGNDVYTFKEPLNYQVLITNTSGALLLTGTVTGQATTTCARCLGEAQLDIEGQIEAFYLLPNSQRELTDEEKEEYLELPEDRTIDLEPHIAAAISLDLPMIPLCKEDCAGLCPQCGADLNKETCSCVREEDDSDNPFAVLKQLLN